MTSWLIEHERSTALAYWEARESGAADVTASRVSNWLDERRSNAEALAAAPSVQAALSGALRERTMFRAWLRERFTAYMAQAATTYHDQGIYLLDTAGEVITQSPNAPPLEPAAAVVAQTVAREANFRADLHGEMPERSLASFTAPVVPSASGPPAGSLMPTTSLADALFPLLSSETARAQSDATLPLLPAESSAGPRQRAAIPDPTLEEVWR